MAGKLFVVGTPLGNRGDLSPRARETLLGVDRVLCEDTRVTARLLADWGEGISLERADAHVLENPAATARIVERLAEGERLAYVTDAGMPIISDPGGVLVDAALDAAGFFCTDEVFFDEVFFLEVFLPLALEAVFLVVAFFEEVT